MTDTEIKDIVENVLDSSDLSAYEESDLYNLATSKHINNFSNEFLQEHYKIIKPYFPFIEYYIQKGFVNINNFYKTGVVDLSSSDIIGYNTSFLDTGYEIKGGEKLKEIVQKFFNLSNPPTDVETLQYFERAMKELENNIKPYDKQLILYRGVVKSTIGQGFFNGKCIVTAQFPFEKSFNHRYCEKDDIAPMKLFKNSDANSNIKDYIYENLGFVSFSTNISHAKRFAEITKKCPIDTLLMIVVPPGTKFILPLFEDDDGEYFNPEDEVILFPRNNTFILYDKLTFRIPKKVLDTDRKKKHAFKKGKIPGYRINEIVSVNKQPIYRGTLINELNRYRPANFPLARKLRAQMPSVLNNIAISIYKNLKQYSRKDITVLSQFLNISSSYDVYWSCAVKLASRFM